MALQFLSALFIAVLRPVTWRRLGFSASLLASLFSGINAAADENRQVLVRDIITIDGIRDNPLIGYGVVVGLKRTGDSQQTLFTTQSLANMLQRLGVQVSAGTIQVRNIAAVMVTASLPPFSRPGTSLDVTVSSIGDAKSLEGGVLLLTSLHAADGQVYAEAQGALTLGGYTVGGSGNSKEVNHVTVGRVPNGGIVERDASIDLAKLKIISLSLREQDFTVTRDVAAAINHEFGKDVATAIDSRRVDLNVALMGNAPIPSLIAKVQSLALSIHPPARVIMNERTGTIVMGGDVKLSPVSVLHGDLTVEVSTTFAVSQPAPFAKVGTTEVVPETTVKAKEGPARSIQLKEGASVEELINGLHTMGATARDIVAIIQAIKAAGGLQADLEVL